MSPQSIVCATCSATVPYGRLSCPSCGELLASVAGAARSVNGRSKKGRAAVAERPAPTALTDAPPQPAADAPSEAGRAAPGWEPPIFQNVAGATAAEPVVESGSGVEDDGPNEVEARVGTGAGAAPSSTVEWPADLALSDAWPTANTMPPGPAPAVVRPAEPIPSSPAAPGAYVPPILNAEPAGAPAPARAWAGQAAAATAAAQAGSPRTSAGDLLDATRLTEFVGWLAVAGSAMAAVGFLLPWGVSVIGATGIGYFDRWGLAGPFHPIVLLSLLAVLGLSLVRNPVPLWLRVGVLGLGLGALLVGLTWPYIVGLSGTGPGAIVVAIGALVLGAAGVGAIASDRHAGEDRPV